jgi:hypothetical protein
MSGVSGSRWTDRFPFAGLAAPWQAKNAAFWPVPLARGAQPMTAARGFSTEI